MNAMRYLTMLAAFWTIAPASAPTQAGEFNRILDVGSQAPAWENLEGVDGKQHSYNEVASSRFVIVAFTCNSCPYAVDAEDRLVALSKKAAEQGGVLVAVNVNTIEEDALPAMRQRAQEKAFDFAYLYDPTQQIAKQFGATTTPEFYVLGPDRKVVYMGSLDDSPDGKAVTKRYVEQAMAAVVDAKQPEVSETVPIGCRIRFVRVRNKK
ncbi:MAG: thioredoxin family protein [Planctomycetaceae bacterium]